MKIDCLVAEIGSTTTVVNAFNLTNDIKFLGRGLHQTTVDTDVNIGLNKAIENLKQTLGVETLTYDKLYASSSAAGGLKMTVHGLVYEMTAKAAKEASTNAGGNIHLVTSGLLTQLDVEKIKHIKPNIIVVAGGTNHVEKDTAYQNMIELKDLDIPLIYAGNIQNHDRLKALNLKHLTLVDNVYPRVDDFNIMPLREKIYETFEKHIIHAKGMQHIHTLVTDHIIPTPGAVMDISMILDELYDGILTIDVGGATTDIHSVCEPKLEYKKFLEGQPKSRRTVEGDLGVYVNRMAVYHHMKPNTLENALDLDNETILTYLKDEPFIPVSNVGKKINQYLLKTCIHEALNRHVGDLRRIYTTNGLKVIPDGRDLSNVRTIFLTGGALIHDDQVKTYIDSYLEKETTKLLPNQSVRIYKDEAYIFASLGVLSKDYKEAVKILLKQTLKEVT